MVSSLRTTEMAIKSSGWLLMDSAQTLFLEAKKRVILEGKLPLHTAQHTESLCFKFWCYICFCLNSLFVLVWTLPDPNAPLEVSPKWTTLAEILDEEKRLANPEPPSKNGEPPKLVPPSGVVLRVLIVAQDEKTCIQIKQVTFFIYYNNRVPCAWNRVFSLRYVVRGSDSSHHENRFSWKRSLLMKTIFFSHGLHIHKNEVLDHKHELCFPVNERFSITTNYFPRKRIIFSRKQTISHNIELFSLKTNLFDKKELFS